MKQITSLLSQFYASKWFIPSIISILVIIGIVVIIIKNKQKNVKIGQVDSKFEIIEEISFNESSEIII